MDRRILRASNYTVIIGMVIGAGSLLAQTRPATTQENNLALNKPATASATESEEHAAAKAEDGDDESRWCADGSDTPQWWQVDLQKPAKLTGCEIRWEFDEKVYKYAVEGSIDGKEWKMLSDQTAATAATQVQKLQFEAVGTRYVRIRVTGLEDGAWASLCEVKVFGE